MIRNFSIRLPKGRYNAEAGAFGYTPQALAVFLSANEHLRLTLSLTRLPHYEVRGVTRADDKPQGGIRVFAGGTPAETSSEWGSGEWSLLLPSGVYTITGQHPLCLGDSRVVTVPDSAEGADLHLWHISSYTSEYEIGEAGFEYPPPDAQRLCSKEDCWYYRRVELPWEFPYWEFRGVTNTIGTLYVAGFGYIATAGVDEGGAAARYPVLGDGIPPNGLIAPFSAGYIQPDNIWFWADEGHAVIFWQRARIIVPPRSQSISGSTGDIGMDFGVVLHRDGRIEFRYGAAPNWFAPLGGVGLEDAAGERTVVLRGFTPNNAGTNIRWRMSRSGCYRPYRLILPLVFR